MIAGSPVLIKATGTDPLVVVVHGLSPKGEFGSINGAGQGI
jgi:hypothetical protein